MQNFELLMNYSTNPAFNLALEEYALTRMEREAVILWRNAQAVIIGRNQNAIEEIDMDYVRENGISVIRRLSGGGAVFHDLGNINFTVINALGGDDFGNYEKFTAPVCDFLQSLGVNARLEGRNDLVIDGMKFSGNAQAVRAGRIMHHGTILFDADMSALGKALRPKQAKVESKGVKSVRARVTNVADHLPEPMTAEEFFNRLAEYFRCVACGDEFALSEEDVAAVGALVAEKYGAWEWNIGSSPAYNFERSVRFPFGSVDLRLSVADGVIRQAYIYGDFFGVADKLELEERLIGVFHDKTAIKSALTGIKLDRYIHGCSLDDFLDLF
ncbi:MAG: lipoate--protein ligase [Oscillospiraceae bacterium]|nr:lipoate--protein ligase [Oscillospiraceae bacterium]